MKRECASIVGVKNHKHSGCPHDNDGVSKPGSHGTGKQNAKAKVNAKGRGSGKAAKGNQRRNDAAHAIVPTAKAAKKAKAEEVKQLAEALEKQMTKNITKNVTDNISAMNAEYVPEAGQGNEQGAAVRRDAPPLTTGSVPRGSIRFRLSNN